MGVVMIYLLSALSAFLWRVRGGLFERVPLKKIWYALFLGVCGYIYFHNFEKAAVGAIACYASYQLYGWGLYVGRLLEGGQLNPNLVQYRECELIDDLLYSLHITLKGEKIYLYNYPKWFGFFGVTLTGLIITFIWGLYFGSLSMMVAGLAMGVCYWIGGLLEKLYPLGKAGWNWGEWIFGAYLGVWLACIV